MLPALQEHTSQTRGSDCIEAESMFCLPQVGQSGGVAIGINISESLEADGVLATLARVGLAANPVHANGKGLVGLTGERAERHTSSAEALHDFLDGLDLLQ
jgi:hypothetical protein